MANPASTDSSVGNRRRGWVLIVLGVLLIVGMGFVTLKLGPSMLHQEPGFTGTVKQGQTYLTLFGLVILFGVNALIGGIRMARTGRRSAMTIWLSVGLVLVIAGMAFAIQSD